MGTSLMAQKVELGAEDKFCQLPADFENVLDLSSSVYLSDFKGDEKEKVLLGSWSLLIDTLKEVEGIRWLRVTVDNQNEEVQSTILYLHDFQEAEVFQMQARDGIEGFFKAGTLRPFSQRQYPRGIVLEGLGNSAQVKLHLNPGFTILLVKVKFLFKGAFNPQMKLYSVDSWQDEVALGREHILFEQALLLGALIIISLYHFLIFLQKRDRAFLLYALYTFFTSLVLVSETGIIPLYFFREQPIINYLIKNSLLLIFIVAVLYFLFMKEFTNLKQLLPKLNRFLNKYLLIKSILALGLMVLYVSTRDELYLNLGYVIPLSTLIVGFFCIVAITQTRNTLAIYFITGSAFLVLGVLLNTALFHLERLNIVQKLPFSRTYLTELGIVIEILVFSLGLGFRSRLQQEKNRYFEELDKLKSKFFANISHEFRTPLTVILGNTEQVKGHEKEKGIIKRNSHNLLRLVNQLLDLSKLESGSLKLNTIQADIIPYLQYLTESLHSTASERKIQLTFYTENKEVVMDFDEEKIQYLAYNLLSNAIKFSEPGGKVVFHVRKLMQGKYPFLQIKVKDSGIGIAPKDIPNLFDRFYQGESKQKTFGTGIGLAFSKELVQMMKGHISVESEVEVGSEFAILLPISQEAPHQKLAYENVKTDENTLPRSLSEIIPGFSDSERPQLLIIEDNLDVSNYIEKLLYKSYEIRKARDGQEGIDAALASVPDIILSDVMMPEKDGYAVCEELKSHEQTSHIPIILLTAKASAEDRVEGLRKGADAYLTKPFNKEELEVRLEKLLALRKALQARYSDMNFIQLPDKKADSKEDVFLQKLIEVVKKHMDDPELSVAHLCKAANLSNMQVNRKLKALTSRTPSRFIRSIRLEKATELLQTTDLNISEIAYAVGFNDPNYFSRSFSEEYGYPPKISRK